MSEERKKEIKHSNEEEDDENKTPKFVGGNGFLNKAAKFLIDHVPGFDELPSAKDRNVVDDIEKSNTFFWEWTDIGRVQHDREIELKKTIFLKYNLKEDDGTFVLTSTVSEGKKVDSVDFIMQLIKENHKESFSSTNIIAVSKIYCYSMLKIPGVDIDVNFSLKFQNRKKSIKSCVRVSKWGSSSNKSIHTVFDIESFSQVLSVKKMSYAVGKDYVLESIPEKYGKEVLKTDINDMLYDENRDGDKFLRKKKRKEEDDVYKRKKKIVKMEFFKNHGGLKILKNSFLGYWLWKNRFRSWSSLFSTTNYKLKCDKSAIVINNGLYPRLRSIIKQEVFGIMPYVDVKKTYLTPMASKSEENEDSAKKIDSVVHISVDIHYFIIDTSENNDEKELVQKI